jgi:septum formation protein
MTKKIKIILASSSKTRVEILEKMGFKFSSISPQINEMQLENESPKNLALRLAKEKNLSVARNNSDAMIIGSDQVAVCNGLILNKPLTKEKAIEQLLWQRGEKTEFFTSIALSKNSGENIKISFVKSTVEFQGKSFVSEDDICNYVVKAEPFSCAGSAKFEGIGISLIKKVTCEDPNALLGLPVIKLCKFLNEWGISPLSLVK